jgi:ABC-type sugar transport system ATPase subunit
LLARAMVNSPTILLLDEPTRGIDVGAKQDVYRWIRETAAGGAVIVMSSLEEEELIGLADRILVLRDGRNVAILDARDASAKGLLLLTAGGPSH